MMRRHGTRTHSIATRVVSGNFTAAKPKGIVDGVEFGSSGDVRFVCNQPIRSLLKERNIVLLNNLGLVDVHAFPCTRRSVLGVGYSAAGDVLNCCAFEADKLICLHLEDIQDLQLPTWLPLDEAFALLPPETRTQLLGDSINGGVSANGSVPREDRLMWDFEVTSKVDLPSSLIISILVCHHGIRRAHLVDASVDGGLLLELYTRDGIGSMISSDFHEGIRKASPPDLLSVQQLLEPLVKSGITIRRSYEELLTEVENFRVFEKEQRILGCVLVKLLDQDQSIAEMASLCIHPDCRGQGKGDSLLTYIEQVPPSHTSATQTPSLQELSAKRVRQLVILTTRTADWFVQRGFESAGPAHLSTLLPQSRLAKIDAGRNSQLYVKTLAH